MMDVRYLHVKKRRKKENIYIYMCGCVCVYVCVYIFNISCSILCVYVCTTGGLSLSWTQWRCCVLGTELCREAAPFNRASSSMSNYLSFPATLVISISFCVSLFMYGCIGAVCIVLLCIFISVHLYLYSCECVHAFRYIHLWILIVNWTRILSSLSTETHCFFFRTH